MQRPARKTRKSRLPRTVAKVAALFLCALAFLSCDLFNKPLQDFLDEWTNVAKIMEHRFDGSYPATGGLTNLPSGGDRVITYYVINPQNYDLGIEVTFDPNLPGWGPIRTSNHPDFSSTSNQGTVEQGPIDKSIIRLTLNENALANLDGTGSTLNPTISIVEPKSGRNFGSYTVPLRVNSAPSKAKNAVIMTWYDGTVYKYAVLFHLPQDLNNPDSPDRDVVSMTISGFNGQYNKTFEIPASGDIGGVENTYAQGDFSPVTSGDSFIPLNGYRFVGIKTDFVVGSVVPSCTVTLRDSSGLESTTDVSTTTTKLTEVYVDPTNGNDSYPGSDILPVATVGKAMEKLSGMTNTTIILVGNVDVQNTLAFTASYPNITLKGGVTPVTLTYSGTGRAITVSGGKLTLGENITVTGADDGAVEITGGEFVMETGSTLSGNGVFPGATFPSVYIDGGAVCVRGGTFTMEGGTINENKADSGGAVFVDGGIFAMTGGTISNNAAVSGGGVSVRAGSFTMNGTDAKIQRNEASQALGGGPGMGGGVQVGGGTFTMIDGTISDNKVWEGAGGGVYVSGGNVSVSGGAIRTNTAKTVGGGVYVSGGIVAISGSVTIEQNTISFIPSVPGDSGPAGRDIYVGSSASPFTISGGKILGQGNKKEIYSAKTFAITGNPTIDNCTITLEQNALINVQGLNASALSSVQVNLPDDFYAENKVLLEKANSKDICGKFALDNPPSNGVWWIGLDDNKQNGILRYINGTLSGDTVTVTTPPADNAGLQDLVNDSADGGYKVEISGDMNIDIGSTVSVPGGADVAIKPDSGKIVTINAPGDTTAFDVSGGELTLGGGGGTVTVDGGEPGSDAVTGNNGKTKSLVTVSSGTLYIHDGAQIQNNKITEDHYNGGGITILSGGTVNMDGGIISGCQTDRYGGGIQVNGGTFNMSGGTISNCYAVNARANNNAYCGGGVAVLNGAVFTMEAGSLITGNHGRWGGGVGVTGGATFIMNGGTIKDNTAEGKRSDWGGGGVHVNNAVFLLKNGEISGNKTTATETHGGGVRVTSGTFRYIICKFENNAVLASKSRGPDVFVNAGVLYATTENDPTQALTANIEIVADLSNPTY